MTPDHYLVIDFEATCCDQGRVPRDQMEIIEIGAVLVDAASLQPIDEFQSFVRPVRHPVLTPFCRQLTSITPEQVAQAPLFGAMVASLSAWLCRDASFVFGSWGDYDLNQLRQDCLYHHLPYPLGARHLNLKRQMSERQAFKHKPGLVEALRLAGMEFEGTAHRGIDDARNIVRLLPYIVGDAQLPSAPGVDRRRR